MKIPPFAVFISCVLFFTISHASPQIAAEFYLKPSLIDEVSARSTKINLAWANPAGDTGLMCLFFLKTDDGRLHKIILTKDLAGENLPTLFKSDHFYDIGKGWRASQSDQVTPAFVSQTLLSRASGLKPSPLYCVIQPQVLAAALNADPKFVEQNSKTLTGALLKEFSDIDTLELRGTPNVQAFRAVAIIKSREGSPMNIFLNQRLPSTLPDAHSLIPVGRAWAYGYFCYNPQAMATYMTHLAGVFGASMPVSSTQLQILARHVECAKGYTSFLQLADEKGPRAFHWGSWNRSNATETMQAAYVMMHPLANAQEIENVQAFTLGEAPVWRLRAPSAKTNVIPPPPPPPNLFYSVAQGNITQASTPEALSQLVQDTEPPAIDNNSFSRNFGHLPTLCFQAKYKVEGLMQALFIKPPEKPSNTPLYAAASLGEGQLALTVDVPYELLKPLMVFGLGTK